MSNSDLFKTIRATLHEKENTHLSTYAEKSVNGKRLKTKLDLLDHRPAFAIDADRILYSHSYTRYIDKTQVFYRCKNDHITHRVLHVQMLSRIARDIGECLGLNLDLIEAIALGHDVGHVPFGHEGEEALKSICSKIGFPPFQHNIHSVRLLKDIEQWNLCLQTYDGILCHDGEADQHEIRPASKTWDEFLCDMREKQLDPKIQLTPMTMEACVVKFSDRISYVGRDIEDAIFVKIISRDKVPDGLGQKNGEIVWSLVNDLVTSSFKKPYIKFSKEIADHLNTLKSFNFKNIYHSDVVIKERPILRKMFQAVYDAAMEDLIKETDKTGIINEHIEFIQTSHRGNKQYRKNNAPEQIALDFIAGMTDDYFLEKLEAIAPETALGFRGTWRYWNEIDTA